MALSPDGKILYLPSLEGPHWHAIDADERRRAEEDRDQLRRAQHDLRPRRPAACTSPDCDRRCSRSPIRAPIRSSAASGRSARPSGRSPINAQQTLCFVNVNDLLGFEIGDIKTGKVLHQVKVTGYEKGP